MSDQLVPFLFEGENLVRVVPRGDLPWFVAADVCRAIGIKQAVRAVEPLDEDEKGVTSIHTPGGLQEVLIVSEGGLYTLVLRSRDATKPGTVPHRFRKWVTSEVLPQIRQTGGYTPRGTIEPPLHPEHREFPEWPLEEMQTKGRVVDLYRLTYGPPSGQWIMPRRRRIELREDRAQRLDPRRQREAVAFDRLAQQLDENGLVVFG